MADHSCFLYGSLLDPRLLGELAPGATFDRVAYLSGFRLAFATSGRPVVVPDQGHTVWGAVFRLPTADLAVSLTHLGAAKHNTWAIDRAGERIDVAVYSGPDGGHPNEEQVGHMLAGARHWELPAGWVAGLEDLIDPFEF